MKINKVINVKNGKFPEKNGRFPEYLKWSNYYKIHLEDLHKNLKQYYWCKPTYDPEIQSRYVNVKILNTPPEYFTTFIREPFILKFNIFSNGKLMIWEKNCGRQLPEWFDEFFTRYVFKCLTDR